MSLIGWGVDLIPGVTSWIPSGIVWGIAFLWLIITIIYLLKHRKEWKEAKTSEYADKIIIDSKASTVLEITNTLQEMANQQNIVMMEELSRRRVSARLAFKLQKESQRRLNIKPNLAFPALTDAKKQELIVKEIKKAGLYKRDFDETHVQYLLTVEWVLDKYNKGLSLKLEQNDHYRELKDNLSTQMSKVSGEKEVDAIRVYLDVSLALNSLILYINYFPKSHINQLPPQANKPIAEIKHDRDSALGILLQRARKVIEDELYGRT